MKIRESKQQFPRAQQLLHKYWELLFFIAYSAVLCAIVLPGLRFDYDNVHNPGLLMSSIRIAHGQAPYRDFFPWYGVLYHYMVALMVGVMGNDLYAVKLFINIVNPILSIALLIFILRAFELPPPPGSSPMRSPSRSDSSGFISAARSGLFCQSR